MDLCTVLLMDDSRYPAWLVLVPRRVRARALSCQGHSKNVKALTARTSGSSSECVDGRALLVQNDLVEVVDLPPELQQVLWQEVAAVACRRAEDSRGAEAQHCSYRCKRLAPTAF